jgi:tartrate dehydratase beta subunit/fumarate hydratase class I family protein
MVEQSELFLSKEVLLSMQACEEVLLSKHINVKSKMNACEDLGTEAIRQLGIVDFPVIVAYDTFGYGVYDD